MFARCLASAWPAWENSTSRIAFSNVMNLQHVSIEILFPVSHKRAPKKVEKKIFFTLIHIYRLSIPFSHFAFLLFLCTMYVVKMLLESAFEAKCLIALLISANKRHVGVAIIMKAQVI